MSEDYLRDIRRQVNDLTSQYDNKEKLDVNDYSSIVNAQVVCSPESGESLGHYHDRLSVYCRIASEKSRLTHIDGPRKAWYTHRNPMGCFMCEDMNLIHVQLRVIGLLAIKYPDFVF